MTLFLFFLREKEASLVIGSANGQIKVYKAVYIKDHIVGFEKVWVFLISLFIWKLVSSYDWTSCLIILGQF